MIDLKKRIPTYIVLSSSSSLCRMNAFKYYKKKLLLKTLRFISCLLGEKIRPKKENDE